MDAFRSPSGERDDGRGGDNLLEVELNKRIKQYGSIKVTDKYKLSSYLGTLPNLTLTI